MATNCHPSKLTGCIGQPTVAVVSSRNVRRPKTIDCLIIRQPQGQTAAAFNFHNVRHPHPDSSAMDVTEIDGGILWRNFNWPADPGQIWRRLTDYVILDDRGSKIEACSVENGHYKAKGTLIAKPGSNIPCIADVEISFERYSIDFGKTSEDPARGYWVESEELKHVPADESDEGTELDEKGGKGKGKKRKRRKDEKETVWYKLELPHPDYQELAKQMEKKVRCYLELHDTLTKNGGDCVSVNFLNSRIACQMVCLMASHPRPPLAVIRSTHP
jgi:hypothetical protein